MTTKELKRYNVERAPETLDLHFWGLIDPEGLHQELLMALPSRILGVSTNADGFVVHCALDLSEVEMERIADYVDRHDMIMHQTRREIGLAVQSVRAWRDQIALIANEPIRTVLTGLLAELDSLKGKG